LWGVRVNLGFVVNKPVLFNSSDGHLQESHHEGAVSITDQSMCGICDAQSGSVTVFSPYNSVFPYQYYFTSAPYYLFLSFIQLFFLFYFIFPLPPTLYNFSN
jgi:hypothetical protein